MRFGVNLPNSGPFTSREAIHKMAVAAEELGYDVVSIHDHINWGIEDRYHFYVGSKEAADALERPTDFYDPISTLSYLCGITHKITLVPSALCLAWRPTLILARQALTLHQLSEGRFIINVCVGNVHKDFQVMQTPWEERGPIAVEKLKALRMIIDEPGTHSFDGKHVRFEDVEMEPRPTGLPIWYSGTSNVALKRAARYGEGWWPTGVPDYFTEKTPELYREAERVGRGDVVFEVGTALHAYVASTDEEAMNAGRETLAAHAQSEWMSRHDASGWDAAHLVGSLDSLVAKIRRYEEAGVTMIRLSPIGMSIDELLDQMEKFARQVASRVA